MNERKLLSKLKHVLRKCSGVSQKWWKLEFSNLCHCVQHFWKLTSRDYWSSRNERKPLSKLKHVLRKCCEVSHKCWMLELSKLCHCVQHPGKLTSSDYWSSRNERKPLSKQNVFWGNVVGYIRNGEGLSFQTLAVVFSTPENWLVGIIGALWMKENPFLS